MVEKIYQTLQAILWSNFPLNSQGIPEIYDRKIENWFLGDLTLLPSPLGVVLRNTNSTLKDIGFGLREIEYSITITFYSSNDDQDVSERVVQEYARVAHQVLKTHRTMWICDLCPFCGEFPLSPIHYLDKGDTISSVSISTALLPVGMSSYIVSVQGFNTITSSNAVIRLTPGISGSITQSEILSGGIGITQSTYTDSYASLNFVLSGGNPHTGYSTTLMYNYAQNVVNQINTFWSETHTTSSPPYYDWAGVAYKSVQEFISDWAAGIQPTQIMLNSTWNTNLTSVVNNDVDLMRLLQNIQVSAIKPSDDGVEKQFLHSAEFTMKAKEIISVDVFGPNNVPLNYV